MIDTVALIALGSNLSFKERLPNEVILEAVEALKTAGVQTIELSTIYRTPAFPVGSGPDFANAVLSVQYAGTADALLRIMHDVEAAFDRVRRTRWAARTLDLDLIAFGEQILPDTETWTQWATIDSLTQVQKAPDRLILPHPRMAERAFVLVPLADVAPDWRHPVTGQTVSEAIAALPSLDRHSIVPWEASPPLVNPSIAG